MESIDVLCDQVARKSHRLEPRQRAMSSVRSRSRNSAPADDAATPVSLSHARVPNKILILNGTRMLPFAIVIAVIGNARGGTAASASQHEQRRVSQDEARQLAD